MKTVDGCFAELDTNLNLNPFERTKAQNLHHEIRDVLAAADLIASSFL